MPATITGQKMPSSLTTNRPNPPDLDTKTLPRQGRAQETFERILSITAGLLAEVGIERLSTNLICERAGLTPPALYRYFPNKYAVLHALGERLMGAQNALLADWATPATVAAPPAEFHQRLQRLFIDTIALTDAFAGGAWIMRALRAVPALHEVRVASHRHVSQLIEQAFVDAYPSVDPKQIQTFARLAVEMGYAVQEMLTDEPDLDAQAVVQRYAAMITREVVDLRSTAR
jgi:AcrR family transcriptional regulator